MTEYTVLEHYADDEYWVLEREAGETVWVRHSTTDSYYKAAQIIRALEAARD